MTADDILDALIARAANAIWASELAFDFGKSRIDFYSIEPIPSQGFRANAYEIKVSRADYLRDGEAKQSAALKWSDRFWYVTPPGLIDPRELPEWAGLQEWTGKLFRVKRKAPPRKKAEPDWAFITAFLRYSGECRRDVGLIQSQLAYFKAQSERLERQRRLSSEMHFNRLIARNGGQVAE